MEFERQSTISTLSILKIKEPNHSYTILTMSHSTTRLSFPVEIYFRRRSVKKIKPVALCHPIAQGLALSWMYKYTYPFCMQKSYIFIQLWP